MNADPRFWQGRHVVVTGAGGFIASWLTLRLVEAGANIVALVRNESAPGNLETFGLIDHVNVVFGSVAELAFVERTLNDSAAEVCFHLAAQALVGAANQSPLSTFESNIAGTWAVLEACRRAPRMDRVVVASSDKAYGDQPSLPYTETMPLLGSNPYDLSKACADRLASSYHLTYGLPVAVSRSANVYGGGDNNYSRIVPGTIEAAVAGHRPVIRSDGTPLRDYIHVDDAVRAYLSLAEHMHDGDVIGQAFNFGANSPISVMELTRRILAACGRGDLEPYVRGRGRLRGELHNQYLDSSRAQAVLEWSATVNLDEGLGRTAAWYRTHIQDRAGRIA